MPRGSGSRWRCLDRCWRTLRIFMAGGAGETVYLPVIAGLDPATSWRRITEGLRPEVRMSPVNLLKGGSRIKSGYDGNGVDGLSDARERLKSALHRWRNSSGLRWCFFMSW
jgi:hypothetical protein